MHPRAPLALAILVTLVVKLSAAVPSAAQAGVQDETANEFEEDFGPDGLDGFDFAELSLEELLQVEIQVTTSGRKVQGLQESPSAIFVLNAEDIRRSGATNIPEALRMVPGVQVARSNASNWAVSVRGFNDILATKLLVLIDGRSVYSPLFSGVYWDFQGVLIEDVERIEVVRGPGAALWGANAVNGVINIVTKTAAQTQGTALTTLVGTAERIVSLRHGGLLGQDGAFRYYVQGIDREGFEGGNGSDASDSFEEGRAGFRVDRNLGARDALTVQGDLFAGQSDPSLRLLTPTPPFATATDADLDFWGGNLLARWNRTLSEDESLALQVYYDRYSRYGRALREQRDTADVDFQHRFRTHARNEIIWGLGYRGTRGETQGSEMASLDPATRTDHLFSLFVQDEFLLTPELRLIAGAKLEHNDYTEFELQPSLRTVWTPSPTQTFWGAVSRAVRTPSHVDHNLFAEAGVTPGMPPVRLVALGDEGFVSEELTAYELGWRSQVTKRLFLDLALFYNDYDDLTSFETGAPSFDGTMVVVPLHFGNGLEGETYGAELAADWRPIERWRVKAGYSLLEMNLEAKPTSTDMLGVPTTEGSNPRHQGSLRVWHDLARDWEIDGALYLVDDLKFGDIPGYGRLDLRLGWRPTPGIELSLVGQGLFHDDEHEVADDYFGQRREVETSAYVKLRCSF